MIFRKYCEFEKCNSLNLQSINSKQKIGIRQTLCCSETKTMQATALHLTEGGANDVPRGMKGTGNGKTTHTP